MISDTIQKQIAAALKARDEVRLSTLRMLSSSLNYERIAKQHPLVSEEELGVVAKEAKKRRDAIEAFRQARGKQTSSNEAGLAAKLAREEEELAILKSFLPEELSESELEKIVAEAVTQNGNDFSRTMQAVMARVKGRADGGRVSRMVKEKLHD